MTLTIRVNESSRLLGENSLPSSYGHPLTMLINSNLEFYNMNFCKDKMLIDVIFSANVYKHYLFSKFCVCPKGHKIEKI